MTRDLRSFFVQSVQPIRVRYTIQSVDSLSARRARLVVFQQVVRYQKVAGMKRWVEHDVTQRETWVSTSAGWRLDAVDGIRDQHYWVDGRVTGPDAPVDLAASRAGP